ncbi:hypothetical protein XELAEV_18044187mg [Xenopus laevis]|uniref:Secreted protein n=1 Tax=Xenopus laevis TaxID=8355 RepID=A0A974H318_XENLA|nr:hypothetical protein XELAEV_18044187mg [Xenopus laevis]
MPCHCCTLDTCLFCLTLVTTLVQQTWQIYTDFSLHKKKMTPFVSRFQSYKGHSVYWVKTRKIPPYFLLLNSEW